MWVLTAAFAQEPVPAPAPDTECFPPCSPGYLCHAGACIEACNPACAPSERCSAERVCVAREEVPAPTDAPPIPAGTGEICVLREGHFKASALRYHVAVDDRRVAILPNRSYACVDISSGAHVLDLSTPTAGVGGQTVRVTIDVQVTPDSRAYYNASIGGGIFSPAMYLDPMDAAAAEALKQKLRIAAPQPGAGGPQTEP